MRALSKDSKPNEKFPRKEDETLITNKEDIASSWGRLFRPIVEFWDIIIKMLKKPLKLTNFKDMFRERKWYVNK